MRPRDLGPTALRAAIALAALLPFGIASSGTARATVTAAFVAPPAPRSCDSTTIVVSGTLASDCERVRNTRITGPVPVDINGVIVQRFDATVVVEEQNPEIMMPCVLNVPPYSVRFPVGLLAPGPYAVRATEYRVPFGTTTPDDSSTVSTRFSVAQADSCPPREACTLLDFVPPDGILPPPGPDGITACDAVTRPGGDGCFAIDLRNPVPVGGVQVEFLVSDPTEGPLPAGTFTPVSVETTPRTNAFTVTWQADGPKVKAVLYSTSGATIPPGGGPILRVCYATSADTHEMRFPINFTSMLIADPQGNEIPTCPTFAVITGWFCVGPPPGGCDLNGDGRADVRDIVRLVRCALAGAGSDACPDTVAARADCNGDGAIDVRDVICCVRKLLGTGLLPPPPDSSGAAPVRVGFAGPATWTTPVDGRAVLEIRSPVDLAAAQFAITPDDGLRIRDFAILSGGGSGASIEWQVAPDGTVRAFLYRMDRTAASGATGLAGTAPEPIRVAVDFEPAGATTIVNRRIVLDSFDGAGWDAAALPTNAVGTIAAVPGTSLAAPAVYPARPNPFAAATELSYALPRATRVSLRLYDVSGRLVRTLVDGTQSEGVHHVRWDGRNDAGATAVSGIYFVKFSANGITRSDRILKLR